MSQAVRLKFVAPGGPQNRQSRVPSTVRLTGFTAVWLLPARLLFWHADPRSALPPSGRPASTVMTVVSSGASPLVPASSTVPPPPLAPPAPPLPARPPPPPAPELLSDPASPEAVKAESVRRAPTCRPTTSRTVVVPALIWTPALYPATLTRSSLTVSAA